ncbi:unannotated protein [freshwater metagenome]|uniref:Unannotated protein n=1 Tax=freshwater metagenome TaxID=449393 RepID=A0A6J5YHN0_9ZZZZ
MAALAELKLDQVGGGLYGGQTGRQQRCCVLARNDLRAHAEMRQKQPILRRTPAFVAQTLGRKALGGGTPAVHPAS